MKKLLTLISLSFFFSGCFVVPEAPRGVKVTASVPVATVKVTPMPEVLLCEYSPEPYYSSPAYCDGTCCVWEFEGFYSMCEEAWCNYSDGCGWSFLYQDCYAI